MMKQELIQLQDDRTFGGGRRGQILEHLFNEYKQDDIPAKVK
jgi:hypothetical protein